MKKILGLVVLFTFSFKAFSYVISKTESGADINWSRNVDQLIIKVNPIPLGIRSSDLNSSEVIDIVNDSTSEWNSYLPFEIKPIYTTDSVGVNENSLSFVNNSSYFGSGVLAVTSLNYDVASGNILSAQIYINDSTGNTSQFTDDVTQSSNSQAYLGDVLTHELGHFIGLNHSEVVGSSMVYSVFKNQYTIANDDIAGALDNYGQTKSSGRIYGRVLGGESSVPVFGAHVLAISTDSGEVVQSQLTDESGKFNFKNLDLSDSYYFYVKPVNLVDSLPDFYSTLRTKYCSGQEFKPSFYSQCGANSRGRPQVFNLNSSNKTQNIGDITIRCDENLSPQYLALKNETTDREFELSTDFSSSNAAVVGYFSEDEIDDGLAGNGDEFYIDLRSIDWDGNSASLYDLKINVASTGIGSDFEFMVFTKRIDEASWTGHTSTFDPNTNKLLTDLEVYLNLSATESENYFDIRVYPLSITATDRYEIFSTTENLFNPNSIYTLTTQAGRIVSGEFVSFQEFKSSSFDDNAQCMESDISIATSGFAPLSSNSDASEQLEPDQPQVPISCGTIDIDSGSGPGGAMMSFGLGILLMLLLQLVQKPFKSLPRY